MKILFLIALGGAAGSVARYATGLYVGKLAVSALPCGTFAANIVGCFLIGICYGLTSRYAWFTPEWRFLLATGFCGGYTTFSTFAYENLGLLQTHQYGTFLIYTVSSLVLGLLAAAFGFWLLVR